MSSSSINNYTSKDVIDYCLEQEFKKNNIKYAKNLIDTIGLRDLEVLIEVKNKSIKILQAKISQGNEWRAEFAVNLLKYILDRENLDLNCKFIINFNDGVPLEEKFTRFCWSRHRDSFHICIPDSGCYQLIFLNKIGAILLKDIPFENKINSAIFRGSDTGKIRDNLLNQRMEFCIQNKDNSTINAKITGFARFNKENLLQYGVNLSDISSNIASSEEQLKYKYIIYIHGNTVSWERLIWTLASNSIIIQPRPNDKEDDYAWYQSFLNKKLIVPTFPQNHFGECFLKYQKLGKDLEIKENQKYFSSIILRPEVQIEYYKQVLEKYNILYNQ